MEHDRGAYLEDLLATNAKMAEQNIAQARERFSPTTASSDVPPVLRALSREEWGFVRSILEGALRERGRLTDSMKIPLLYLAAESWDTIFWMIEHAWREELELEETLIASYREEVETLILTTLPCMLPPSRLQAITSEHIQRMENTHDAGTLFREIQRIREEEERRAFAIRTWCGMA